MLRFKVAKVQSSKVNKKPGRRKSLAPIVMKILLHSGTEQKIAMDSGNQLQKKSLKNEA
jgi:hypothetical protein